MNNFNVEETRRSLTTTTTTTNRRTQKRHSPSYKLDHIFHFLIIIQNIHIIDTHYG